MKDNRYRKRTQKDYSMNFKLSVVQEVEKGQLTYQQAQKKYGIQGKSTVLEWLRKYGNFDWDNQTPYSMSKYKSPEQKDIAEREYNISIRKNSSPEQSINLKNSTRKA